ncbi:ATP-dependent RecD-like DNA helicase [Ruegeria sp. 2012CJ41-6]|uniref:ATP-dependent RecD-like DNA helicase n=1 Tax=Ruegeria spongiae TaxID=2942209 RepID=A0ABT0Q5U2_9RHOB|nr:AAA family ATPase [Ruegeria spongiae]MCL6284269.1 ATP-dependent RecD-like DNA helicase [Ruegeria spongiae]
MDADTETKRGFGFGGSSSEQIRNLNYATFLREDPDFVGIGSARAGKLVKAFGLDLHAAIISKDKRLNGLLPLEVAAVLCSIYPQKLEQASLALYLDEIGISRWVGRIIVRAWGSRGVEALRENPYLLVSWLSWPKVDELGLAMGVKGNDTRRLTAAVEAVLYTRLERGHTWTPENTLKARLRTLLRSDELIEEALDASVEHMGAILIAGGYQPIGAGVMERVLARRALRLSQAQGDLFRAEVGSNVVDGILKPIERAQGFPFTSPQRRAIETAINHPFCQLGGYAGSGKTSVLKGVCNVAVANGRTVHLMALAGRAAKRITEATGFPASTIYKFIKDHQGTELNSSHMIVIDEASMVDLSDMYRVIRASGDAQIVLTGDPAQLPPIGFGTPFNDLMRDDEIRSVTLDRVHRQSASSGIPTIAEGVRDGITPNLLGFTGTGEGVTFFDAAPEDAPEIIKNIGRQFVQAGTERDDIQIICPVKKHAGGVIELNNYFSDLKPGRPTMLNRPDIRVGDPIVYLKTDLERGLRNGSLGRLLEPELAEFDGEEVDLTWSDADNIDLAYCLTVHKSQGSQWRRVIVPIFNLSKSKFVDRSMIYTAITRATEQVVLIGDFEVLRVAIEGQTAANRRQTAMDYHIGRCLDD